MIDERAGREATTAVCVGCAIALFAVAAISAHEIGTTRVSLLVADRDRYEIHIVTDATTLLERLAAASGARRMDRTDSKALSQQLDERVGVFLQRIEIAFDGRPVHPDVRWTITDADTAAGSPVATIQLTGRVPHATRQLTWTYSWTSASYSFTVRRNGSDGAASTEWLEGGQTSQRVDLEGAEHVLPVPRVLWRYAVLGFTHILPKGSDHVLFVLGIFLLNRRVRPIVAQVSAFTVAHSLTLGLSMYGVLSLEPSIVEPLVAISIAYIAFENIALSEPKRWRIGLVFAFGLLHGLGFAGALREVGLPEAEFLAALVGFNAGVEAGQLTVIGVAFVLVSRLYADPVWYRRRIVVPASALIACVGALWTVERMRSMY